jgi:RNA polymerase sigma-70 factor (ECF subfamily)
MSARALKLRQSEPTDAELVASVLDGDVDAYGTLVHRYQNLLYRHARGMGLDHDTSLDLVQDAFVRAFDRLHDCREGAHYRAWLFRIGHNLCVDELRNVRRLCVPMSTVEHVDQVEDEHRDEDETTLTLRAALERLPQALREAFLLKHDAGYTYDEVAVITGASPSAVKMRVHRAREALRAFLVAEGVSDNASNNGCDDSQAAERLGDEESQIHCDARANTAHVAHTRRMS